MARISTYIIDTTLSLLDKWIGTDSNGGATKNFTAKSIAELFNRTGSIGILGQNNFKFQTDGTLGREQGSISFDSFSGDNTAFSSITELKLSKYSSSQNIILEYLQSLEGEYVLLAQIDNLNNFGIYKLNSLTQDIDEPNFYNASFSLYIANGNLISEKYYGIAIYPTPVSLAGDKHYVHNQSSASITWNVNHNLNKYPSATVTLSTGQVGYGDITYIDENNLTITFAGLESGKAYIN